MKRADRSDRYDEGADLLHALALEYRRLARTTTTAPREVLLGCLSLDERLRLISPRDIDPAQRAALTDLLADVEETTDAVTRAAGGDAEAIAMWFHLELERFHLVALALRKTARDADGDLAARNPDSDSLRGLRAKLAALAERGLGVVADVRARFPEAPPTTLTRLASEDHPSYVSSLESAFESLAREKAHGQVPVEFVERLRSDVDAGLAALAEGTIAPRSKLLGGGSSRRAEQEAIASDTLAKVRVLRIAAEFHSALTDAMQQGMGLIDAIFDFDRDDARGGERARLEGRFPELCAAMWSCVTKVRLAPDEDAETDEEEGSDEDPDLEEEDGDESFDDDDDDE